MGNLSQSKEEAHGGVTVLGDGRIVLTLRGGATGQGGCHDPGEGGAARSPGSGRIPPSHGRLRMGQVEGAALCQSCNRAPGAPAPPSAPSRSED